MKIANHGGKKVIEIKKGDLPKLMLVWGIKSRLLSEYCLRLSKEEDENFYDWYFTTGAVVQFKKADNGTHYPRRMGTFYKNFFEELALRIGKEQILK